MYLHFYKKANSTINKKSVKFPSHDQDDTWFLAWQPRDQHRSSPTYEPTMAATFNLPSTLVNTLGGFNIAGKTLWTLSEGMKHVKVELTFMLKQPENRPSNLQARAVKETAAKKKKRTHSQQQPPRRETPPAPLPTTTTTSSPQRKKPTAQSAPA